MLFVTGLLSYAAYNPGLSPVNDTTPGKGWLGFYLFSWPTRPVWLYRVNQGVHVTLGLVLVPILLAKLWSVLPRLFEWPPLRSPAHALERLSLFLLVGGGRVRVRDRHHEHPAVVRVPGLLLHACTSTAPGSSSPPSWSTRPEDPRGDQGAAQPRAAAGAAHRHRPHRPEPPDAGPWSARRPPRPRSPGAARWPSPGAGSLLLLALSVGQSIGGPLRRTALLAPHGQDTGGGPADFQINVTAAEGGITAAADRRGLAARPHRTGPASGRRSA